MSEAVREDRTDLLETSLDKSEGLPEPITDERVRQSIVETRTFSELPMQVIEKYAEIAARRHATIRRLPDGKWFATIPGFEGVWASESSLDETLDVLEEVAFDWTLLKIEHRDKDLPVLEEIDLNVL